MPNLTKQELPYTLKPDEFSSHAKIAQLIKAHRPNQDSVSPYIVLDIGCADGFLRHFLTAPDYYLLGTDINEGAIAHAQAHYNHAYLCDITQEQLPEIPQKPHSIVFADILEHLVSPEIVLKHILRKYAEGGTQVILTLPNIANIYVRLSLLLGRFTYTDKGILDRTHLRFFTVTSAKQLIQRAGIRINTISATPLPLPLISGIFARGSSLHFLHRLNHALALIWKSLFGYQIVIEGVVNE